MDQSSAATSTPAGTAAGRVTGAASPIDARLALGFIALLWLQLYSACIYGWRFGEYYDYGWYVPPLLALCLYRLRKEWTAPAPKPAAAWLIVPGGIALFGVLALVRSINRADPRWTLPIWIQAAAVVAASLWLVHQLGGPRAMLRSIPLWIFACSAIPLPTAIEQAFIGHLTDTVISSAASLLALIGYPIEIIGDRLIVGGELVRVTEGCSGIRSAQSFLMISLFFGEWLRLRISGRVILVAFGFLSAWVFNSLRATTLAVIRVENGPAAFDEWHDPVGYLASIAGAGVLYGLALLIDHFKAGKRKARKVIVERRPA